MENYLITYSPRKYKQQVVDTIINLLTVQLHITKYGLNTKQRHVNIIGKSALNTGQLRRQIRTHTRCTTVELQVSHITSLTKTIAHITKNNHYDIVTNTLGDLEPYVQHALIEERTLEEKFNRWEFFQFCRWYWRDPAIAMDHPLVRKYPYIPQNVAKTQEHIEQLLIIYVTCTGEVPYLSEFELMLQNFWYLYSYYSFDGEHSRPWLDVRQRVPAAATGSASAAAIATPSPSVVASDDGAVGDVQAAQENKKGPLYLGIPEDPVAAQTAAPHMFGVSPDDDSAKPNKEQ